MEARTRTAGKYCDFYCVLLLTDAGNSKRPFFNFVQKGKKIVSYEEGGTNGLDGPDMLSRVGMLLVTNAATGGRLESWLLPICGDSQAICASE